MSEYHAIQFYTLYIKVGSTNLPNSIYSFGLLQEALGMPVMTYILCICIAYLNYVSSMKHLHKQTNQKKHALRT